MKTEDKIWSGPYSSWGDLGGEDGFHHSEVWLTRAEQKLLAYIERRSAGELLPLNHSNLPLVMSDKNLSSVLHVGGASGWQYLYFMDTNFACDLKKYSILETKEVAEKFSKNKFLTGGIGVSYIHDVNRLEEYDLVYANSVLQYFPDLKFISEIIAKSKPRKILVDDALVVKNETFYAVQHSYGYDVPCTFINVDFLINSFRELGYKLVFNVPFMSQIKGVVAPLPLGNFPENYRIQYPRSLLFISEAD